MTGSLRRGRAQADVDERGEHRASQTGWVHSCGFDRAVIPNTAAV